LIQPKAVPLDLQHKHIQLKILWDVTRSILPAAVMVFRVLGFIFASITTPTEASAISALGAIILADVNRKFRWSVLN
jgi:TRAP-type mannitol/chloroaromatic compound transport system permease large subunit